jgi:pimeloyl-ACP methyl ester carboxylesterase
MAIVKNLQLKESLTEINAGLSKWEKPTIIIWGKEDPWLSVNDAENLAKTYWIKV